MTARSWTTPATNILVGLALLLMLVLSPTLGSASSVLALLLSLPLLALLWQRGALATVLRDPALAIFVAVLAVLTVCYAVTARKPQDILFFANFLAMLLAAPIFVWARHRAGSGTALLIARLATAGALVGLGFTAYDAVVNHAERAMGLIGNPNMLPRLALPLGFFGLMGVWLEPGPRRWLYLIGPAAALVATWLTGSRGSALAIPAMGLVALVFMVRRPGTRKLAVGLAVAGIVATAGLVAWRGSDVLGRFATTFTTTASVLTTGAAAGDPATQERLDMYSTGWTAFSARPVLGWGWANLGNAAAELGPPRFDYAAGTTFLYHNDAVNFGVAAGVIGLGCLVALLLAPAIGAFASRKDRLRDLRLYGGLVLTLGFAIFGLTDSTLGYDAPTTLFAYLTALLLGGVVEPEPAA